MWWRQNLNTCTGMAAAMFAVFGHGTFELPRVPCLDLVQMQMNVQIVRPHFRVVWRMLGSATTRGSGSLNSGSPSARVMFRLRVPPGSTTRLPCSESRNCSRV